MSLNKILPILFSPIFLVLALMLASILLRRRRLTFAAFLLLALASLPVVADQILKLAQGGALGVQPTAVAKREAIVVLAGAMAYSPARDGPVPDWGGAIDRVFAGIELMRADRGEKLIFSSGRVVPTGKETEGELAAALARQLGVAPQRIVLSPIAENTADEARLIRVLFPGERPEVILVTSAYHMRRAVLIFENAGFAVTPFPVDTTFRVSRPWYDSWLPDPYALNRSDLAIRELIGQAYYRLVHFAR